MNEFIFLFLLGSCGLPPLEPLTPLGCDSMEAVCMCEDNRCKWIWVCR